MTALIIKNFKEKIDDYMGIIDKISEKEGKEKVYFLGKIYAVYDIANDILTYQELNGVFDYRIEEVGKIAKKYLYDK